MIFLFEKALKKKGCQALCSRMIQFCDFWKKSTQPILKIFLSFLSDFCKLYPTYYKNIQNLYDEIAQILVKNKMGALKDKMNTLSSTFFEENQKNIQEEKWEREILNKWKKRYK